MNKEIIMSDINYNEELDELNASVEEVFMLTTLDNPYNPFTQYASWFAFDTQKGYNTCGYIARIANVSDELSESQRDSEINAAIDEILALNVLGIYVKVTEKGFIDRSKTYSDPITMIK